MITSTDGKGNTFSVLELPFALPGLDIILLQAQLPVQPYGNYLVEVGVRLGHYTRSYDKIVVVIRQYTMLLPVHVKGGQ
jgi:hypothetical protein